MRLRTVLDQTVGMTLLLGPLVYALTLGVGPRPTPDAPARAATPQPVDAGAEPGGGLVCEAGSEEGLEEAVEPAVIETPAPAPVEPSVIIELDPDPDEPGPETSTAGAFYFVSKAGLVLTTDASAEWGHGRLRRASGEGEFNTRKPVDPRALPDEHWAARGRLFDLYGVDGKVCTARISRLSVVAQYFGEQLYDFAYTKGYEELDDLPASEWMPEVWDIGHRWLVGQIVSSEDCDGALWARDASLPPPRLLRAASADTTAAQARRRLFKGERERVKAAYARYVEGEDERGYARSWKEIERSYPLQTKAWIDEEGRARFVELQFGQPEVGCGGGFDSEISTVHAVDGDRGALTATPLRAGAQAVFDADLDGRFEFLHADHYLLSESAEVIDSAEIGWDGCPC